ncbi:GerAB/ArcD/ProY family transporter [Paenibacillus sp. CGMCC 1.16610]|uniref:GerAB/ArcD/ProY family transporter n=1 Tax=Paenibacillus anseongense TaxID=2682845 RepID=A0ABW9U0M2_9BACL|nr:MULTISPECIES: GerAB/ArcD/ProY family transporter [Paenibacillus]MBA2943547.1 GerAB/ArcD/ProY family transporter [Paenibacillus sp. CGMCC 1.16610]MVQ33041.1 GerAB/ArcD/ProY family transporter [Paenibacillus anseongense]
MKTSSGITGYEMFVIQMLFSGAAAGFIYPSFLIRSTSGSYWIPIAVWVAGALLSSWLYSRMLARLEDNKLIAAIRSALGSVWTSILCLPVLLFLFGTLVVMLRAYSEIVTMTMLPTTPISFLNGMLLAPAALALAGMMPIVRAARVFFLLAFICTLALLILGFSDIEWTLGTPWLRTNGDFLLNKHFYAGSFVWMGFTFTSLIGSYRMQSARRAWRSYVVALLCALPLIAGYVYLPVMTFGRDLSQRLTFPFISKMDSIYHYWIVFESMTAIFVSVTMLYVLITMALQLHALGEMIKTLMPRAHNGLIYVIIFIFVYTAATLLSSWREVEHIVLVTIAIRLYIMFAFPLLGMAVLVFARNRRGKGNEL